MLIKYIIVVILVQVTLPCYSLETANYYGTYDLATKKPWRIASSLTGPQIETWQDPVPKRSYRIGVLLPHINDSYWLAVNQALVEEAQKLNISLKILSADGYNKGAVQHKQLTEELTQAGVDGIILASVFYDKFDRFIAELDHAKIPIVGLINDLLSPLIKSAVNISFYEIGEKLAQFILEDAAGKNIRIALFPGPQQAAWATDLYDGFMAGLRSNAKLKQVGKITIVSIQYAPEDLETQKLLVAKVLVAKSKINYIIANPIAAIAASELLAKKFKDEHPDLKIIASYLTAESYALLKNQQIYANVLDFNMDQARMALHLMVRYLNGETPNKPEIKFPLRTTPVIQIATKTNLKDFKAEQLLAKQGFKPTLEVNWNNIPGVKK